MEEPDRVPIYELAINAPVAKAVLGRMPRVDAYLLVDAEDYYDVYVGFGLDAMTMWDVGLPVKYVDAETFIDDWGRLWRKSEHSQVTYYLNGTIRSPEDLEGFSPPDPYDDRRLEPLRRLIKMNRANLAIIGGIHDAFEIPSMMRGIDAFLLDYYRNPEFAERLIEMNVEYNVELAKAMIDLGVDALITGDDYAYKKGPLMCPEHFKRFIAPYLKRIAETCHRKSILMIKHTDGYLWPIIDDIINAGVDALHPIEPQARMNLSEVKDLYGDSICIVGNVDVSSVLPLGTVDETVMDVKRCLREAADGGGYILSSSNSIHDSVKPENFRVMIKAAKKYGRYSP
ncbi:MAG: uroporphyrinogen decarboxylase family protein [Candidatus Bathyarchaeia archaeon]